MGYARVSTTDQDPQLQLDALNKAECEQSYTDHASGAATARPQLDEVLRHARRGDAILVWRLDRLGRSMRHLADLVGEMQDRGIGLRSLNEQIDTTTSATATEDKWAADRKRSRRKPAGRSSSCRRMARPRLRSPPPPGTEEREPVDDSAHSCRQCQKCLPPIGTRSAWLVRHGSLQPGVHRPRLVEIRGLG